MRSLLTLVSEVSASATQVHNLPLLIVCIIILILASSPPQGPFLSIYYTTSCCHRGVAAFALETNRAQDCFPCSSPGAAGLLEQTFERKWEACQLWHGAAGTCSTHFPRSWETSKKCGIPQRPAGDVWNLGGLWAKFIPTVAQARVRIVWCVLQTQRVQIPFIQFQVSEQSIKSEHIFYEQSKRTSQSTYNKKSLSGEIFPPSKKAKPFDKNLGKPKTPFAHFCIWKSAPRLKYNIGAG